MPLLPCSAAPPNHRSWHAPRPNAPAPRYLDGALLRREARGPGFEPPARPLYLLASIWADAARGSEFGGRLDYSKSPFYSTLSRVLKITCNGPPRYNGPAWTYTSKGPLGGAAPAPLAQQAGGGGGGGGGAAAEAADAFASISGGAAAPDPAADAAAAFAAVSEPAAVGGAAEAADAFSALESSGPAEDEYMEEVPPEGAAAASDAAPASDAAAADPDLAAADYAVLGPAPAPAASASPWGPADADAEVLDEGTVTLEAGADGGAAKPAELPGDDGAGAAPGGVAKGVYLGCFDAALLQMEFGDAKELAPEAAPTCIDHCRGLRAPVYALSKDFRCLCLADAPHPAAALPRAACLRRDSPGPAPAAANPVPIFYAHARADETCGVTHTKLSWDTFEAAENKENAAMDEDSDSLTLRLEASGAGARLAARRTQKWGMLSFKARVSDEPGVITSLSVSSPLAGRRRARRPPLVQGPAARGAFAAWRTLGRRGGAADTDRAGSGGWDACGPSRAASAPPPPPSRSRSRPRPRPPTAALRPQRAQH
jgi:hypothetical protein